MSKKFGKFLLFTAAAGTAAAAYYFYKQKKETDSSASADEDYDDFSEDAGEDAASRNYVSLQPEDNSFTPLEKAAKTVEDASEKAEETVEEFFDEGDASDEEPPIQDN